MKPSTPSGFRHLDSLLIIWFSSRIAPPACIIISFRCQDPRKISINCRKFRGEQSKLLSWSQRDWLSELMCLAWLNGSLAGAWQLNCLQIFEGCKHQGQERNHWESFTELAEQECRHSPTITANWGLGLSMWISWSSLTLQLLSRVSAAPVVSWWDSEKHTQALPRVLYLQIPTRRRFLDAGIHQGKGKWYLTPHSLAPSRSSGCSVSTHPTYTLFVSSVSTSFKSKAQGLGMIFSWNLRTDTARNVLLIHNKSGNFFSSLVGQKHPLISLPSSWNN